ncbi:hypothetical protein [Luteimicrobium sp. DT211]|uniref:hypothetical protein n=1 Tax=Luteimicrobium sp. DT211 TaxID=3393412 RepID=UPI003CF8654C
MSVYGDVHLVPATPRGTAGPRAGARRGTGGRAGRALWSRLDELPDDDAVLSAFRTVVDAADVPVERAERQVTLG